MKKSINNTLLFSIIILLFSINAFSQHETPAEFIEKQSNNGFWENKGQITDQFGKPRPDVLFLFNQNAFKVHLKTNSFSYELYHIESEETTNRNEKHDQFPFKNDNVSDTASTVYYHRIDVELIGANLYPQVLAQGKSDDYNNYYLALTPEEGVNSVHYYQKIVYKDIYPNIDMVFYANDDKKGVKYDFVINPGGNPDNIKLRYKGANNISITKENELEIHTSEGNLAENIPISFYREDQDRRITTTYSLHDNILSFDINNYDPDKAIVIDPVIRLWGTYYGGNGEERWCRGIATDTANNIIIIGRTESLNAIATSGSHQSTYGGGDFDVFIAKFNPSGVRLWGTYYGGSDIDEGWGITTDKFNNIIITGRTESLNAMATAGSHQSTFGGGLPIAPYDAFIAKFNSSGVRLWGTYYGGSNFDVGWGITTDANNNIIISGFTESLNAIATSGSHQSTFGGLIDAFIVKFTSSGVRLWGTYYGGTSSDQSLGITTDAVNNIIITGITGSRNAVATSGSHQSIFGMGSYNAYIAKFNPSGARLWGTYYGGSDTDLGSSITTDSNNNIIITGRTSSINAIATPGSHQSTNGGDFDAFIAKFNSSGVRLWGTYYGGSDDDNGNEITTDAFNNIIITGETESSNAIATSGSHQLNKGAFYDAFIAKFNSFGVRLWGTYYGGEWSDIGNGITTDAVNNIILAGWTASTNAIATSGSHQSTFGGYWDAFIAKFTDCMEVEKQPQNNAICVSDTAVFYIYASSPFSLIYQWEYNDGMGWKNITNGGSYSGAYSNILTISNISYSMHNYRYRCYIKNTCDSIYSDSAALNIMITDFVINNTSQCINTNNFVFTNTSTVFDSSIWDFGDDKYSYDTNASHTYDTTSWFHVKLIVFKSLCSDSIIKSIYVNPKPEANFTLNNISQCFTGNIFHFKDSSVASPSPITSWQWNFGDTTSSVDTSPVHQYNASDTFYVSLIVSTNEACRDTIVKPLIVHPSPVSGFIFQDSFQCLENNDFVFVNTSTISSGKLTYLWKFGDNDTSTLVNPQHSYEYTDTFTVKLIATSGIGCKDSISSGNIYVDLKPYAVYSVNDSIQCLNGNIFSFTNLSIINFGSFASFWDFGDSNSSIIQNPSHSYTVADSYLVSLTVSANGKCKDTSSKYVYVNNNPIADFLISNPCKSDSTLFISNSNSGNPNDEIVNYQWKYGDGSEAIIFDNPKHMYNDTGIYSVTLIIFTNTGCIDTIIKTVQIHPQPNIALTGDTIIIPGQSGSLQVVGSFDSILWSTGDFSQTIIVTDSGFYSIRIVDYNGCSITDSIKVMIISNQIIIMNTITPNGDEINDKWIILNTQGYSPVSVNIYNKWGDEVYSSINYVNDWEGIWKGKQLSEGTYYYILKTKQGNIYKGSVNILR